VDKKPLIGLYIFAVVILVLSSLTNVVGKTDSSFDGSIVFAPLASGTTYMINEAGEVTHTWESNYLPGLAAYWLPGNSIIRSILVPGGGDMGGQGGGVQIIASDGTLVWEFIYANETHWSHHDVALLPNGNVLILARELKSSNQVVNAGRDTSYDWQLFPELIIEVHPTGPTSGEIVWEWHVWDHLVQDFDQTKENYGEVSDPRLVNINYAIGFGSDWLHANSLDYNERLDQILLGVRDFNEIWVIDHSTTSEQSAGHSGGLYGKGGDLLYRWGNPQAYDQGLPSDRVFYLQHDARWVKDGYPGSGNIMVFNNGWGRGSKLDSSSVDELTPPIDGDGNYIISQGQPYGPTELTWSYTSDNFFAFHLSGAERLPNGNTLILQGEKGEFFVVNPNKEIIWTYDSIPLIFNPCFVPSSTSPDLDTEGSLQWNRIKPGETVLGSFQVRNIGKGRVNWTINNTISWGNWSIVPSSGYNYQNITTVTVTLIVPEEQNSEFEGYIRVLNMDNPMDFELVPVILSTATIVPTIAGSISNLSPIQKSIFYIFNHLKLFLLCFFEILLK